MKIGEAFLRGFARGIEKSGSIFETAQGKTSGAMKRRPGMLATPKPRMPKMPRT